MPDSMIVRKHQRSVDKLEEEIAALEKAQAGGSPSEEVEDLKYEAPPEPKEAEAEEEENLTPSEQVWKKRHGDLRRHTQKQIDELKAQIEALKSKAPQDTLPTNPEEVRVWADKNPKAAAIIRMIAEEYTETSTKNLSSRLEEMEERSQELARAKEEAKIVASHADFYELVESKEFLDWAEKRPPALQNMIFDGTSAEVIEALDIYKLQHKIENKREDKKAAKSVGKSSRTALDDGATKGRFSESQVEKMSSDEYERNEEAIAESMRNGSFVYDLTGGAR